jgi:hypothetical protein
LTEPPGAPSYAHSCREKGGIGAEHQVRVGVHLHLDRLADQQVHEVPAGSAIRLDYLPDRGTHVRIGHRDLGVIPGERFNRALRKIWLGDNPIPLSLKKALLGQDSPAL